MARAANKSAPTRLQVRVNKESHDLLVALAKLGIYGSNAAEVARHFILVGIQDVLRSGEVERLARAKELLSKHDPSGM